MYDRVGNNAVANDESYVNSQFKEYVYPPGPSKYSLDSFLAFVGEDYHIHLMRLAKKYGDVFNLKLADRDLIVLNGPYAINEALKKQSYYFHNKADFKFLKTEPQSRFIELKSGEFWKRHDEIGVNALSEAFGGNWGEIEEAMGTEVDDLVSDLRKLANQHVDPGRRIALANFSFWHKVVFGARCSEEDKKRLSDEGLDNIPIAFMNAIRVDIAPRIYSVLRLLRSRNSFGIFKKALVSISNYIDVNVEEHKRSRKKGVTRDIADHLLNVLDGIPDVDKKTFMLYEKDVVFGTIFQMSTAGTAVPTFATRWALLYMALNPDVQTKVQEELDRVVGRERLPALADRSKLVYTQACMHEVLRYSCLSPMAPVYYSCSDDTTIGRNFIPANSPVLINYYSLTRDETLWENPERFYPERFIDGDGALDKVKVGQFYPFGVGVRRCIGEHVGRMQIFLLFSRLLHQFIFERPPNEDLSLNPIPGAFLVPKHFNLSIKPR